MIRPKYTISIAICQVKMLGDTLGSKSVGKSVRSKLKQGDVLLTITGVSYGKSATIPQDFKEGNINQHSVKMEAG